MSRAATAGEARAFVQHMGAQFHARIVRKSDAVEMKILAGILQAAGVVDFTKFLTTTATAIGPLVYLPDDLSPDETISVVTHECQHVYQFWTGGLGFAWLYLTQPEKRVAFEAEAYGAQLEVDYWRAARLPPLAELVLPLEGGYLLDADHTKLGEQMLEAMATRVAAGVPATKAGVAARAWLAAHAPELEAGR